MNCKLTSIALMSMRVSLKGIFSGNFSLTMATSKQSPKSMWMILPLIRSNIRFEGCLKNVKKNNPFLFPYMHKILLGIVRFMS